MNRAQRRAQARAERRPWKSPHVPTKAHAWCRREGCPKAQKRQLVYKPLMVCGPCLAFGDLLGKLWSPHFVSVEDAYVQALLAEFERQEREDEEAEADA